MQPQTLTEKILTAHAFGQSGAETRAIRPAQVLLQDATGTLVMQALEAIGLERVQVDLVAQYVDHNVIQADYRNADDHAYLRSCADAFGIWFSEPGNGVSHPVHAAQFGRPGAFLLGSDSHTCAAGALAMLGIGAGSFDVAATLAGEPFHLPHPKVRRITLTGAPPAWVGAKDAILTLIGRYGVAGCKGFVLEYDGPGVAAFGVMDRMAMANMGAEMGATASVFPSDARTRAFLEDVGRPQDWTSLAADPGAEYADEDTLDLSALEPMIARPSRPDDVVTVRSVAGTPVGQAYVGSSASPGFADIARVAALLEGRTSSPNVSLDINPATRSALLGLMESGDMRALVQAGARFHQIGCNGCNGMGQAPGTGVNSLRTVPRNFPGRSGSADDRVWLCGPETAAAAALTGQITDPRDVAPLNSNVPEFAAIRDTSRLAAPGNNTPSSIVRGPNIARLGLSDPVSGNLSLPVLLRLGNDISTDAISPAGVEALALRSNPQALAEFTFRRLDAEYAARTRWAPQGHIIVAGENMGQGSSREHATLCPRLLGLKAVIALSFARIFNANLINVGILPLVVSDATMEALADADRVGIDFEAVQVGKSVSLIAGDKQLSADHGLTAKTFDILRTGGLLSYLSAKRRPISRRASGGDSRPAAPQRSKPV